jgi:hypothetical protein
MSSCCRAAAAVVRRVEARKSRCGSICITGQLLFVRGSRIVVRFRIHWASREVADAQLLAVEMRLMWSSVAVRSQPSRDGRGQPQAPRKPWSGKVSSRRHMCGWWVEPQPRPTGASPRKLTWKLKAASMLRGSSSIHAIDRPSTVVLLLEAADCLKATHRSVALGRLIPVRLP